MNEEVQVERAAGELTDLGLPELLLLDRTKELGEQDVLYHFALEELLCRHVGEGGAPLCHLWRHPKGFVMGLRDSRLPGAAEATAWLEAQGYCAVVRNSGGAAVPLDPGVVNVSLILPKRRAGEIDFRDDFERMYLLLAETLKETGCRVEKGEILGAYCPGDFDLSIGGRKFCGIAQRRQAHAYVVQAFVIVEGSGTAMARLARGFYDRAAAGREGLGHPDVAEGSMASLQELAGLGAGEPAGRGAERFTDAVKRVVRARQTPEGMRAAAERFRLPEAAEVREMAAELRRRYGIAR
ncbi:lipoate--protein ligase family protein [Paenibacillus sp. S-38]|uniref:lipoate--protein ligase family protein n=1 Tax=Paenibacillus sp. S-38 TaxID=3416710 RepID=UPI003CF11493